MKPSAKKSTENIRGRGRPDKLTDEIQKKITQAIQVGSFIETAAQYAGISKVTLYSWLDKGNKQERGKYRDFLNAVEQAFAMATVADLAKISEAASHDWRAAAWRLEKREKKLYGAQAGVPKVQGKTPLERLLDTLEGEAEE